jgi:hypothetical protein
VSHGAPPPPLGPRDLPEGWEQPPQGPPPPGWKPSAPGWGPAQQPPAGRIVTSIIAGGILGVVAGAFAASLLEMVLTGSSEEPGALVLLMLVFAPAGGLLGAFWGMRRGRRPRRPPRPMEDWRRHPNRLVDVHRRDREEG